MAKKKGFGKFFLSLLGFLIGGVAGFGVLTYVTLPNTDTVNVSEEVYYSFENEEHLETISVEEADVSVHFLELGNKYTGDCTYIKTKEADILIDCGSKSNSISTVTNYLNQYVTDGILEYVIVTHAHQDHYAGFATSAKIASIFDLYECQTIIDFAQTNQKATATTYQNYQRELADEINKGATHYTALDCINQTNGAQREFFLGEGITLEILDSYYYTNKASTENDYSVCCLVTHDLGEDGERNFLFTGDLEEDGEYWLTQLNELPKVDLYKAGHHGSKTSSSQTLMKIIEPKTICVCCCAGSSEYKANPENTFPSQLFIDNVAPHTDEIYVTTLCVDYSADKFESFNGNIVYLSNFEGYSVECSNNKTKFKDSQWFKANRQLPDVWKLTV